MAEPDVKVMARSMATKPPRPDCEYYSLTLTANESGGFSWSAQTEWAGFKDEDCRVELRKARLVSAEKMVETYRDTFGEGCFVVDTPEELRIFYLLGGHSVIEKAIAEEHLHDLLKPAASVNTSLVGFRAMDDLDKSIFHRAPTKKQRMRILKRDNYRCKICGRAPRDNVDITLHVHHIRPWARRGVTHDDNLITLCHTCHDGLDPHEDIGLYAFLNESGGLFEGNRREKFLESLKKYREATFRLAYKAAES